MTTRKSHTVTRACDWCQNQWPWMTLKGHNALYSKRMRLSEPTTKIWMKVDPYYQRRTYSQMTLDSGNIRFMWIFEGVLWRGASNDSEVIENYDFEGLRRLRLRHLRNEANIIVLFSPLSSFHWPQNTWDCVTLNGYFVSNSVLWRCLEL